MKNLNIYLVRHGERTVAPGTKDMHKPLAHVGHTQARELAAWFSQKEFVATFSSPARRAIETTSILVADRKNERVKVVDSLFRGKRPLLSDFNYFENPLSELSGDVLIVSHIGRIQATLRALTNNHPVARPFVKTRAPIAFCRGFIVRIGSNPEDVTVEKIAF